MTYTNAPNAPFEDNPGWQEANRQLGADLKLQLTPNAGCYDKTNVVLAGDDLPDVMFIQGYGVPHQAQLLQAKFADLTPYLSGDAVKDYPNLASLPTLAWKNAVFNKAIRGVPTDNSHFFWALWARQDLLDAAGVAFPTNSEEFKEALIKLTRAQAGVWGIGSHNTHAFNIYNATGSLYAAGFEAPNMWSEANGKFTRTFETEQFEGPLPALGTCSWLACTIPTR
jgi:putative aldouronate transport system substrate-binding protein